MGHTERFVCRAPVFGANIGLVCLFMYILSPIIYAALIVALIVAAIADAITGGRANAVARALCAIKRFTFRLQHCTKGNDNPDIIL